MNIHDVRLDQWYKAPDGRIGKAEIIDNNLTHDVLLRGADFSVWVKAAELEPADAPSATPDLEQRIAALEAKLGEHAPDWAARLADLEQRLLKLSVWREIHKTGHEVAHEWLTKQLDALKDRLSTPAMATPDPTPTEPLKVGDEVWVKGKLLTYSGERGNYRVDLGMGACFWCRSENIKRA